MATERVTRNRTGPQPTENRLETGSTTTDFKPAQIGNRTGWTEPSRLTRPNDSLEQGTETVRF